MGHKKKNHQSSTKERELKVTISSAKSVADAAYERGKKEENERINHKLEERIRYYAETIGAMEHLDCNDGAKTAKIALNALRWCQIIDLTETTITPELMRELSSDD